MADSYFITTFGCAQNEADSERIAAAFASRGMKSAKSVKEANYVVINTCMIREMAENRVYGAVHNLAKQKEKTGKPKKIIVTGCMVGMAVRDKTGAFMRLIRKRMPDVDEFLPIEEVGFDHAPLRTDTTSAWVPISNGCNNFCTYCVVPFTRGREVSRPSDEIISECKELAKKGYKKITLLGMNVNSYGADLITGKDAAVLVNKNIKPVYVKHLGRLRIPTLFPYLLEGVSKIDGIEAVDFMSSNPWDFSDELIDVIAKNQKVTRAIHLPVQSGSTGVLGRMNRWYTREQYLDLAKRLKSKIPNVQLSTDIIVGFCGETEEEFEETVTLAKKVGFYKAYVAMYSDRPMTAAHKSFKDDVPHETKKRRWKILEDLINIPNLKHRSP